MMTAQKYTHFARILSPRGAYPSNSVAHADAIYLQDADCSFSVCELKTHTRGGDGESYSEVEWLNPTEARLFGSLMLAVDREESFVAFYPFPTIEPLNLSSEKMNLNYATEYLKPFLIKKFSEPDIRDPGYQVPLRNKYSGYHDITPPTAFGGAAYDFRTSGIDYGLADNIYRNIDLNDALVIRGVTTLIKAAMLQSHFQFVEAALYSLFISMEVSFRLVVRALRQLGVDKPNSKDAMDYIHDAFQDIHRVERYFEDYYDGRIMTFHPESRYGVFRHAPMAVDDYYFLFDDMLEVYAFLICGFVHPRHKEKQDA